MAAQTPANESLLSGLKTPQQSTVFQRTANMAEPVQLASWLLNHVFTLSSVAAVSLLSEYSFLGKCKSQGTAGVPAPRECGHRSVFRFALSLL